MVHACKWWLYSSQIFKEFDVNGSSFMKKNKNFLTIFYFFIISLFDLLSASLLLIFASPQPAASWLIQEIHNLCGSLLKLLWEYLSLLLI